MRRAMIHPTTTMLLLLALGCGRRGETCITGATSACACPGGATGVQTCQENGTLGTCACPTATPPVAAAEPDKPPVIVPAPEPPVVPARAPVAAHPVAARPAPASPSVGGVPEQPSPADLAAAKRSVDAMVRSCGHNASEALAPIRMQVVFDSDGNLRSAHAAPPYDAADSAGTCATAALRSIHVPPFRRAAYATTFTYSLR